MSDPFQILKAKRAKIIEDAKLELAVIDNDLRELERFQSLANKYGLTVVADPNQADHAFQSEPDHVFQSEPIRGADLMPTSLRRRRGLAG